MAIIAVEADSDDEGELIKSTAPVPGSSLHPAGVGVAKDDTQQTEKDLAPTTRTRNGCMEIDIC